MKMKCIFVWLLFLVSVRFARANPSLTVYLVAPPIDMDWSSPKSLLLSTLRASTQTSYELNGHMAVEIHSDHENEFGVSSVLTSMGTQKPYETSLKTISKGLGLGALVYDFKGKLDSSDKTAKIIKKAKKDERLYALSIPVTQAQVDRMFEFLSRWIEHGSFRHYRGGQVASSGLGAGCADFVMYFIHLALKGKAPLKSWMQEHYLPMRLIGAPDHKVPATEIIKKGDHWGADPEDGPLYRIPDPQLIYKWASDRVDDTGSFIFTADEVKDEEVHDSSKVISETQFSAPFPEESVETQQKVWDSIQLD